MALIDSCVHYYKFDNSNTDELGTTDMTVVNTSYSTTKKLGTHSLLFNGSTAYAIVANSTGSSSDLSFSFWTKQDTTSGNQMVFGPWGSPDYMGQLRLVSGGSNATVNLCRNGDYATLANSDAHSGTMTDWNHWVITINGTTQAAIVYLNGSSLFTGTLSTTAASDRAYIVWGCGTNDDSNPPGGRSEYFDGLLDALGVWTKVLTSTEVTSLYNGGDGFDYPFSAGNVIKINIGDAWKESPLQKINIGDVWKTVEGVQINIGDVWKTIK